MSSRFNINLLPLPPPLPYFRPWKVSVTDRRSRRSRTRSLPLREKTRGSRIGAPRDPASAHSSPPNNAHDRLREAQLYQLAKDLMPRLPFDEIDLLIGDRVGKDISGAGMDPNIIGRWVQGYSSSLMPQTDFKPFIRRIFVRDLTPETHGNAIGIGFADFTTTRLVRAMDLHATYTNALTALTPQAAKIPIHFDSDRECIQRALISLAIPDTAAARIVRIRDTLSLNEFEISERLCQRGCAGAVLEKLGQLKAMAFDVNDNLKD